MIAYPETIAISQPSFRGDANGSGLSAGPMTGSASNYGAQLRT
jgi:hypothetical protein